MTVDIPRCTKYYAVHCFEHSCKLCHCDSLFDTDNPAKNDVYSSRYLREQKKLFFYLPFLFF